MTREALDEVNMRDEIALEMFEEGNEKFKKVRERVERAKKLDEVKEMTNK